MITTSTAILILLSCVIIAHAQNTVPTTVGTPPGRTHEMEKDDLICKFMIKIKHINDLYC